MGEIRASWEFCNRCDSEKNVIMVANNVAQEYLCFRCLLKETVG